MTKVKICGITSLDDARLAVGLGADAIGFNFFPGSKRYIEMSCTESIVEHLADPIIKVGVFVNQSLEEILEAQGIAELDMLQLHGDESTDLIHALRSETDAKIIKVFRVGTDFDLEVIDKYKVDAVMLDSRSNGEYGGTGGVFDWAIAARVRSKVDRLYLAGGLNAENVTDAIRTVSPYAVDVASGVESSPRRKDPDKVAAFIRAAKEA